MYNLNNFDSFDILDSDISDDEISHSFSILQFILNCFLHVSILFFFLYILFVVLIGPIAQRSFKNEFDHIIHEILHSIIPNSIDISTMSNSDMDNLLSSYSGYNSLDTLTKSTIKLNIRQVHQLVKNNPYILKNYLQLYSSENYLIAQHNDNVDSYGKAIIGFLLIITLMLCISFKYYYPQDVNLTKLFIENMLTFIFIGAGEYWFFTTFAVKFVPAPPSLLSASALTTISNRLKNS
jgi:hypothetical protein